MYFLTSKDKLEQAEQWLDKQFDYFLQKYGRKTCMRKFGTSMAIDTPRRETKPRVNCSILAYIRTLPMDDCSLLDQENSENPPAPVNSKKRRTLIEYVEDGKNAWNTPLLADNQKDQDNNQDVTTTTTVSTNNQGILNLTDGESISNRLSFMKEEFQKSINMANKERELSLSELQSVIKNTKEEYDSIFINQDKVIKALQKGQQQTNETIQGLQKEFSMLNKSLQQLLHNQSSLPMPNTVSPYKPPHYLLPPMQTTTMPYASTLYGSENPGQFPPSLAERARMHSQQQTAMVRATGQDQS